MKVIKLKININVFINFNSIAFYLKRIVKYNLSFYFVQKLIEYQQDQRFELADKEITK